MVPVVGYEQIAGFVYRDSLREIQVRRCSRLWAIARKSCDPGPSHSGDDSATGNLPNPMIGRVRYKQVSIGTYGNAQGSEQIGSRSRIGISQKTLLPIAGDSGNRGHCRNDPANAVVAP